MGKQDSGTLTTLTLTARERAVILRALGVTVAMLEALGDDTSVVTELQSRVRGHRQ